MRLRKDPKDVYAEVFGDTIEVGSEKGYSGAIPWRSAERVNCSPQMLADMLNTAYRAGQLNLWHSIKEYLGMK